MNAKEARKLTVNSSKTKIEREYGRVIDAISSSAALGGSYVIFYEKNIPSSEVMDILKRDGYKIHGPFHDRGEYSMKIEW